MRLKSTLTSGLMVLAGAICTCAAEVNSSPSRREPMAVTPELLDQAFASLKGFDVKPEAPAPQPKEISGEKKSPYALYRLEHDQQLSDWQGVIELAAAQAQPDAARRAELEQRFLALCKPASARPPRNTSAGNWA